jgi:hypothetical protein
MVGGASPKSANVVDIGSDCADGRVIDYLEVVAVSPAPVQPAQKAADTSGVLLEGRGTPIVASGGVEPLALPARSPNLNAYAERWVRSVKEECLSRVILFGERSLRRALSNYVDHFHAERNHQGKGNVLLFPRATDRQREGPVRCRERLGGLLRYYHQEAA